MDINNYITFMYIIVLDPLSKGCIFKLPTFMLLHTLSKKGMLYSQFTITK